MINFVPTLFGSIGMAMGTLPWPDFVQGLALIILAFTLGSMLLWHTLPREGEG